MNLPNKLTILRILLVPLIAAVYLISAMSDALGGSVVIMGIRLPYSDLIVLGLFVLASVTDFFDAVSYTHLAVYKRQMILYALYEAGVYDKRSLDYIERILVEWKRRGLTPPEYEEGKR